MLAKLLSAPKNIATRLADLASKQPTFQDDLKNIFDFRFTSPSGRALIKDIAHSAGKNTGTVLGGAGQGLVNPNLGLDEENSKTNRLINILLGAVTGRYAGGYAGSKLGIKAPDLIQKGVGRVVTNVRAPDADNIATEGKLNFKQVLNAIIKDKPSYTIKPEDYGRDTLYRRLFNLDPREEAKGFLKAKAPGIWEYNADNPYAKKELESLATAWARRSKNQSNSTPDVSDYQKYLDDLIGNNEYAAHARTPNGFKVKPDGKFESVWDFSLKPGETYTSPENVTRGFLGMFGNPEKLVGTAPTASRIVKNIPESVLQDTAVRKILTNNLAKRMAESEGMPVDTLRNMLSQAGSEKLYRPEIQRNLLAAHMKNKNFNALQHALNMLSVKGTGNSFDPKKHWNLGSKEVHAWGPHRLGFLQGPSGKKYYGVDSDKSIRRNMSFVSDLPVQDKKDILNKLLSQDKDFPELYQTDAYIKDEINKALRKETSDRLLKARSFVDPMRFTKEDILKYF